MAKDESGDIVGDAVDAVTMNQDVQWERCARLATPAERTALEMLRSLAGVFMDGPAGVRASGTLSEAHPDSFSGTFVRGVVRTVVAIATVEVAAALFLLLWDWDGYRREHGDVAFHMAALLIGHGASACLLLSVGRRDRRTRLLGVFFLLKATLPTMHILPALLWGLAPPHLLHTFPAALTEQSRILLYLYAFPFAFSPAMLWEFARECPRVYRRTRLDDLARRMVPICLGLGGALWVGMACVNFAGAVDRPVFTVLLDTSLIIQDVLSLGALAVVGLRARTAPAAEKRRTVLFSVGFLVWAGWVAIANLVEVFTPGYWLVNYQWSSDDLTLQLLRFPTMLLLWYSVLAVRVPHPREVLRAGYRRLLMRPGLLGATAAAPAAALAWLLVRSPEQEVGAVIADPLAQSLFAAAGILLLVVLGRERFLLRLDAWIDPETADQRQVLAAAAVALARAERMETISRRVSRAVKRGCGSPSTLLVATDPHPDAHDFRASDTAIAPLPRTSATVHMLETAGGPLRVHPSDSKSVFELLPVAEAAWVVETAADVIVPVPGAGVEVVGILVVGRRFDDRIVRTLDVPFLEVLAAAVGQAIMRLRLLHGQGARLSEAPPALECPVCRYVRGVDEAAGCDCGPAYVETDAPRLLAGRFQLTRRLGAGGMGSVHLARDLRLKREVAVKTVAGMSVPRLLGLKPEAWAMATVAHPAVAQIYGVESWRGRPFLIVEFLPGGTLADRLRDGPLPGPEAVAVTANLAEALAALHRAGYLHGDVKPSNIGFTTDGEPKLLDFGLARRTHDTAVAGGTLCYLSPEVLAGCPGDESDDVWSLCVVLYEVVSGEHPFTCAGGEEVADRIRRQLVGRGARSATDSETQAPVAAFAASMLRAARSARPATARAFAVALREMVGTK